MNISVSDRRKTLLALAAVIGLAVLFVVIIATAAQGAFHLRYAPGYEPRDRTGVLTMRLTDVQPGIQALKEGREIARERAAARAAARRPVAAPQRSGGCYTEPGTPPAYVLQRESGGNPRAANPVSSARGCWQFIRGTWDNYGGYPEAHLAPVSVQNAKAKETWAGGAGCSHWSAC